MNALYSHRSHELQATGLGLSPLDERQLSRPDKPVFSVLRDVETLGVIEFGVLDFPAGDAAALWVIHQMEDPRAGLVPRNAAAVSVLAEVLS